MPHHVPPARLSHTVDKSEYEESSFIANLLSFGAVIAMQSRYMRITVNRCNSEIRTSSYSAAWSKPGLPFGESRRSKWVRFPPAAQFGEIA